MKVMIVGGGKVGTYLAALLLNGGYQVNVIEKRPERIAKLEKELPKATIILGSGTDPVLLEEHDIQNTEVMAVVTGKDEINLVASTLATMEYGVRRVIARVNNPQNAWLFTPEMGVDSKINEAELIASLVAEEMSLGDMMTLLKLNRGRYSLVEEKVHPDSGVVNKMLSDLNLPEECTIAAIIRDAELIIPHGDTILSAQDEVLIITHITQIEVLTEIFGRN